ncbi:hypothetical protein [uncultured Desulfuromusa sp.]|uniref:hypothetical protein n=1 Tax=uncultured Desulfuromusa sp. TaxID=219183 RepID=UPI002AA7EC4F|nr:hypothetical protein [uncultured Desulfuromusa sp.]
MVAILVTLILALSAPVFAAEDIGTTWGFWGDSQTDGRASEASSCTSSPECIGNILGTSPTEINGVGGRSLDGSHAAYDGYAGKAELSWVHFQESGNQDLTGQATAAAFGTTFEADMTNIASDSPSAVISYETAFSFGREAEAYRDWTDYNLQLYDSVETLSGSGVTVIVADVDANIKRLQDVYTPSAVWYQSGDTNEYHYTELGNFMVAVTVINSLGFDLDALDYSGVADLDADQRAAAISIAKTIQFTAGGLFLIDDSGQMLIDVTGQTTLEVQ